MLPEGRLLLRLFFDRERDFEDLMIVQSSLGITAFYDRASAIMAKAVDHNIFGLVSSGTAFEASTN